MRCSYETAYERETDEVLKIMARTRAGKPRRKQKARRQAGAILVAVQTATAALTVIAAAVTDFESAFIGAALLLALTMSARAMN